MKPMSELTPAQVRAGLDGDARLSQAITTLIEPVVRARVKRWRAQMGRARRARLCMDDSDLTQDVLTAFYDRGGRLLRLWNPERGLSLRNWVGFVAQRLLIKQRMDIRRAQHETLNPDAVETALSDCEPFEARAELTSLLRRLEERASPHALAIFVDTCLGEDAGAIATRVGISEQAVYAARRRLTLLVRELRGGASGDP